MLGFNSIIKHSYQAWLCLALGSCPIKRFWEIHKNTVFQDVYKYPGGISGTKNKEGLTKEPTIRPDRGLEMERTGWSDATLGRWVLARSTDCSWQADVYRKVCTGQMSSSNLIPVSYSPCKDSGDNGKTIAPSGMPIIYPTSCRFFSSLRQTLIISNGGMLNLSCVEETRMSLFSRLVMLEPPSKFPEDHNSSWASAHWPQNL